MKPLCAILALVSTGCTTSLGTVGTFASGPDLVSTKLLRPGARARACRTTFFGVAVAGEERPLDAALGQILALDREGDVLTNVVVRSSEVVTGVYNRRCVDVEADLGRAIRTIMIPLPEHDGHESH